MAGDALLAWFGIRVLSVQSVPPGGADCQIARAVPDGMCDGPGRECTGCLRRRQSDTRQRIRHLEHKGIARQPRVEPTPAALAPGSAWWQHCPAPRRAHAWSARGSGVSRILRRFWPPEVLPCASIVRTRSPSVSREVVSSSQELRIAWELLP